MKKLLYLILLASAVIFVISLPMKNLLATLKLTSAYMFFIFLPPLGFVYRQDLDFIEKFFLTNVLGLGYGFIYIIFDLVLNIPLTSFIFIITALVITFFSWRPILKI